LNSDPKRLPSLNILPTKLFIILNVAVIYTRKLLIGLTKQRQGSKM